MLRTDEQWLEVADAFANAAFASEGWHGALEQLAEATGGRYGQLICIGPEAPQNNIWTLDPETAQAFFDEGFADPAANPRIRAGMAAPVGAVLADADFITPEAARQDASYRWGRARQLGFICLTTLLRTGEHSLVGLAVNRTPGQGHISSGEKRVFASLSQHVRSAVRTQMLLEGHTAQLLTGALEAMSIAAFACDRQGRVMALSPHAEALVSDGQFLTMRERYLNARLSRDTLALTDAIQRAVTAQLRPGMPVMSSLFIRSACPATGIDTLLLDVMPLPRKAFSFGFGPQALVVVRGSNGRDEPLVIALKVGFGLTEGEARVALQAARGKRPEVIASERGVSVGTVRAQIRSIYDKMGVHHQGELVARLKPE